MSRNPDAVAGRRRGPPSWWPITDKRAWQDAVLSMNFDLACRVREMIPSRCWSYATLGDYLGIPEWLVMCLAGVPSDEWWNIKSEWDCLPCVVLP